jgi:dihydropteroate synthase
MQDDPQYADVVGEVGDFLQDRARACEAAGIDRRRILLDPGFGFGKTVEHNLLLLQQLQQLTDRGYPVLVGLSRKSLIGKVLGLPVDKRLYPGLSLAVIAAWQGARIIRTHDVGATCEALAMCHAVMAPDAVTLYEPA